MRESENNLPSEWRSTRFWLAIGVTIISILAVTVLATVIIHRGDTESPQNVLNSVLPLLGTWVGTILAYYFSKENFEAATRSVTELAKQVSPQEQLKTISAKTKMLPREKIFFVSFPADQIKLIAALDSLEKAQKGNRIPVLASTYEPKFILHRSLIDKFLSQAARSGKSSTDLEKLTLQDLLNQDTELRRMAESFAVVSEDATLADAMNAMARISDCQDVFVTRAGTKQEEVLGWVTNVIIQENARV
jgi:hypothetical protein